MAERKVAAERSGGGRACGSCASGRRVGGVRERDARGDVAEGNPLALASMHLRNRKGWWVRCDGHPSQGCRLRRLVALGEPSAQAGTR